MWSALGLLAPIALGVIALLCGLSPDDDVIPLAAGAAFGTALGGAVAAAVRDEGHASELIRFAKHFGVGAALAGAAAAAALTYGGLGFWLAVCVACAPAAGLVALGLRREKRP